MSDFIDRLKKTVEGSYDTVRTNAGNIRDIATDVSKLAKMKYEMHQLKAARDKKLALLGKTVYPYLLENNVDGLKKHETLSMLLDEIKNLSNQAELLQHQIETHSIGEKQHKEEADTEDVRAEIEKLEKQIEERLTELKAVKDALEK